MKTKTLITALVLGAGFSLQAVAGERIAFQAEGDLHDELQRATPSLASPASVPVAFQSEGDLHDELARVIVQPSAAYEEPIRQAMSGEFEPAFRAFP